MTLDQWLQEATGTFPPGIRERLAQEYTAHVEDSVAAGGSGDALELFGKPESLKRQLKKHYVSQERMDQVKRSERGAWLIRGASFSLFLMNLYFAIKFYGTSSFTRFLADFLLFAIPFMLILSYSHRWEKTRRASFQLSALMLPGFFISFHGLVFDSPDQSYVLTGLALSTFMIITFTYTLIEDRRIERTQRIEGFRAGGSQSEG